MNNSLSHFTQEQATTLFMKTSLYTSCYDVVCVEFETYLFVLTDGRQITIHSDLSATRSEDGSGEVPFEIPDVELPVSSQEQAIALFKKTGLIHLLKDITKPDRVNYWFKLTDGRSVQVFLDGAVWIFETDFVGCPFQVRA